MDFIWYNPQSKSYQVGNEMEYNIQVANSNTPEDHTILYELDAVTSRLAGKIVNELNSARSEVSV